MFIFVDLPRHSRRLPVLVSRNGAEKIGPGPEDCFSVRHPLSIRYRIPTVEKFCKPTLVSRHFQSIRYW
jgi:hypothetical protein